MYFIWRYLERRSEAGAKPDDYFFVIPTGGQIITLAVQFDKVPDKGKIFYNSYGEKFSLYSLRHHYAVQALLNNIGVWDVARNMGTSVEMIQQYYGKDATPKLMATTLGGKLKPKQKLKPQN